MCTLLRHNTNTSSATATPAPWNITDVNDPLDKTKGNRRGPSGLAIAKKTSAEVGGPTPASLIGVREGTSEHPPHVVLELHEDKVGARDPIVPD
jgi:hypothetical protein